MNVTTRNVRPFAKNTLIAFFEAEITDVRQCIRDCTLHRFNERFWIGLPGKPHVAKDGSPILTPGGKPAYTSIIQFGTRSAHDDFQRSCIASLRQQHPELFANAGQTLFGEGAP
jgi:hypothetical protein